MAERGPVPQARDMSFVEHLDDLRGCTLRSLVYVTVGMAIAWNFRVGLLDWLSYPAREGARRAGLGDFTFHIFEPAGGIMLMVQIAALGGLVLASGALAAEAWHFFSPALHPHERRYVYIVVPASVLLFLAGVWFFYYVSPQAFGFLMHFNTEMGAQPQLTLVAYLRFFDASLADHGEDDGESDSYLAMVLPGPDEPARIIDLGTAEEIDHLVLECRRELVKGIAADVPGLGLENRYRKAGTALRSKIWDPVHAELEGADTIFLVPDSALHLVSFVALPIGDEHYLVEEKAAIHYLSAERELTDWAEGKRLRPADIDLLLFGNPDFGTSSGGQESTGAERLRSADGLQLRYAGLEFAPLPGTKDEVEQVAALWQALASEHGGETGAPVAFTGGQADESTFKRKAPDSRVAHLATHAFFIEPESGTTTDAIKPQRIQTGQREFNLARPDENPLLRAGLALAGANRRGSNGENGILTAEEIVSLDLGRVELAVLSACDTGLGTVQSGEGVFGLRRSFRLAGVDTVINSLWPVEDVSTAQWMQEFYRSRFEDREATVEAVRRASLAILESRRGAGQSSHPFFWAAFVAAGDWR